MITNGEQDAPVGPYETQSECQTALEGFGSPAGYSCQEKTGTFGGVTEYSPNVSSMDKIYYLKHTIVNNIVTESYVVFVVTEEMASANAGMTAGTYTLRGAGGTNCVYNNSTSQYICDEYSPYYETNKTVLKNAFGSENCTDDTTKFYCSASGLGADAISDGFVHANDGSYACSVDGAGSSHCDYFS